MPTYTINDLIRYSITKPLHAFVHSIYRNTWKRIHIFWDNFCWLSYCYWVIPYPLLAYRLSGFYTSQAMYRKTFTHSMHTTAQLRKYTYIHMHVTCIQICTIMTIIMEPPLSLKIPKFYATLSSIIIVYCGF